MNEEDARVGSVNTLFFHLPGPVLIGVMLLGLTGCGARASEVSTKALVDNVTPAVTQSHSSPESAPASLETFGALLDRA
jgi:hypothetical protein